MRYSPEQLTEIERELQQEIKKLRSLNTNIKESHRIITNLKAVLYYHTKKGVKDRFRQYYLNNINPNAMRYNNGETRPIKTIQYEIQAIQEEPVNDSQIEEIQTTGKVKFGF